MVKKIQQLRKEQFPKKKKKVEALKPKTRKTDDKSKKANDLIKVNGKKRVAKPLNSLKAKRMAKRAKMTDEELAEDEDLRYFEKVLGIRKGKALPKDFVDDGFGDLLESLRSDSEYESGESDDENDMSVKEDLDAEIEPDKEEGDADDDDDDDDDSDEDDDGEEKMEEEEEEENDDDDDEIDSDDAYGSGDEERIAAKQAEIKKRKGLIQDDDVDENKKGKKNKGLSEPVVIEHNHEEEEEEEEDDEDDDDDPMNDEIDSDDAYCSGDEERIAAKQAEIKKRKGLIQDDDGDNENKKGKKNKGLSEPTVIEHKRKDTPTVTTNNNNNESTSILDNAEGRALTKIVKSQINRLADTNIEPIFNKIMSLESEYTIVQITEALVECIISSSLLSGPQGTINIVVQCSLCGLLNSTIGSEFGGLLIERITRRFIKATTDSKDDNTALTLVVMYSHLYNFHVVGCTFIYDVIKNLIKSFTALDIEMLLTLLKQAGPQLRRDDPSSLKDIVLSVQERSEKALSDDNNNTEEYGSRVQYMLNTIYELKNNSQGELPELILADRIRKSLHKILEKRETTLGANEIRISWAEVATPGQKGRWWIVGSAFGEAKIDPKKAGGSAKGNDEEDALAALARKHRMTTGARKAIFGIILSSDDFIDAFQRIMKLGLKGPQERDIVLVLMYCCSKEKRFNPYYMHLALKLCNYAHNMKFTFQTAFWDQFKNINTMKPREAANIAMLMAYLVGNNAITLAVLKPVEFEALKAHGVLFFRIFFETLLTEFDEETIIGVFKKLAIRQDDISIIRTKEGISLFYLQGLGSTGKAETQEEEKKRKLLRQRIKLTKKILMDSVSSDMF